MKAPVLPATAQACSDKLVEDVSPTERRVWLWFPQLGGYGSKSAVSFTKQSSSGGDTPGCFDIELYHDGEFPQDEVCFRWHACNALQWARFGLDVYEKQLDYQTEHGPEDVAVSPDLADLLALRNRIDEIITQHMSAKAFAP